MKTYKMAIAQQAGLVACLLLVAMPASAAVRNKTIRIKVLDSETRSVVTDGNNGVPKNCDFLNYDAYCHHSRTEKVTNTLLIQETGGVPFRIACDVDSTWSTCSPLTRGASFDAVMEKRGVVVYYQDGKGKLRKQLYVVVAQDAKPVGANTDAETNVSMTPDETNMQVLAGDTIPESWQIAKCHFESTPTGADIDLDGRYVGSTPSAVGLSLGKHVVVMSANGFAPWKREMTVSPQSELTVNAVLQRIP